MSKIYRNKTIKDEGFPDAISMDDVEDGTTYGKVKSDNIKDGSIKASGVDGLGTLAELNAVSVNELLDGCVTELKLADQAVTNAKIAVDAIQGAVIAAGAITENKLYTGAVTADKIAANTITAAKIAANTITASQIAAGTITATEIATNAVTADKIYANAVTADKINVSTLSAISANIGSVTAGTITGVTITGGTLQTSTSGQRIVMSSDVMKMYASTGTYERIGVNSEKLYFSSGDYTFDLNWIGRIYKNNNYELTIENAGNGVTSKIVLGTYSQQEIGFQGVIYPIGSAYDIGKSSNKWGKAWVTGLDVNSQKITNLATPTTDYDAATKKYVDDNAGSFSCSDLSSCNISDIGTRPHASLTGIFANQHHSSTSDGLDITPNSVVSDSACNLAGLTCNGNLQPNNSNTRYCGTSGAYWSRVYSDAYFTKNTEFQTFDKYDDLQILRNLKFDKKDRLILKNLPKEIAENGFINFGGLQSFNLCASKKIVETIDDLNSRLKILETNKKI